MSTSGFTSGKTTHDPEPWLLSTGARFSETVALMFPEVGRFGLADYAPRPEFDNHNPILVWLRALWGDPNCGTHTEILRYMLNDVRLIGSEFTIAERDHARRVLTKLAALT